MLNFNTYKQIKKLQKSGFDEQQAEGIINSLVDSKHFDYNKLATREQVILLEKDTSAIKQHIVGLRQETKKEINGLKQDVERLSQETKHGIDGLRQEMKHEISHLKQETKHEIGNLRLEMEKFATKEQLILVESKLKDEINITSRHLIQEIARSKNETLKWIVGLFIALLITIFIKPYFH